jgi:hypothetical protein
MIYIVVKWGGSLEIVGTQKKQKKQKNGVGVEFQIPELIPNSAWPPRLTHRRN